MTIHQAIKERRLSLGWSHERLAAEVSEREGLTKPLAWQTVQQWESGRTAPKRRRLGFVAQALGCKIEALIAKDFTAPSAPHAEEQPIALDGHTVPPQYLVWEQLMSVELPGVFEVELPDDAMAPRAPAGRTVRFALGERPRAGDGVLLRREADGAHFFRVYKPERGDQFEALAYNPAFRTLDSKGDGVRVIAVMVKVLEDRWG